ncbi:hypothetical protein DK926_04910 [Rhodococcus sp. Eu-32]|uniref:Swt1 family HEPN domain-containing protein n=1 Tax=Rhodococcus sp. Eu-32 TaxID=1017319 RepID=UPI000DF4A7CC|nr:Swt1 family HEPN domain-containing protein [Rhodococcus sp. Eu-32]RRQ29224.1 hypothetical protein DK926_04910 [Rhodococcus sp. Eu-32]
MALDWQTRLYGIYKDEVAKGLDQFLTRIESPNWPDLLAKKDGATATRNNERQFNTKYSKRDPQASLRMLTEEFREAPAFVKKRRQNTKKTTEGLASAIRDDRNNLAHFAEMSEQDVYIAMARAAELLESIRQPEQARRITAMRNELWNQRHSQDDPSPAATTPEPPAAPSVEQRQVSAPPPRAVPAKPARVTPPAVRGERTIDPATATYIPDFLLDPKTRGQGAPPEPKRRPARRGSTRPGGPVGKAPRRGTSTKFWALLAALVVVVAAVFLVFDPTSSNSTAPNSDSAIAPPAGPAPAAPAPSIVAEVSRYAVLDGIPGNQSQIVIQPRIGNSSNRTLRLFRSQLRVLIAENAFNPATWMPPHGSAVAGTPTLVQLGDRSVWSVPMNDNHLYDWTVTGGMPWATLFYDGTAGDFWDIPPAAPSNRLWQLAFHVTTLTSLQDIVGFGVVDEQNRTVSSLAPLASFPPMECPCTWW